MLIYFIQKEETNTFYITSGNDVNKIINELELWSGNKINLFRTMNLEFDILNLIYDYFRGQSVKIGSKWYNIYPSEIYHLEDVVYYSINILRSVYISVPLLDERDNEIKGKIKEVYLDTKLKEINSLSNYTCNIV